MKINYLLFLSVTAIVRLDNAETINIFQNRANKCFYQQNNPLLPTHHPSKNKTILSGNSWFAFLSTVSIGDMDSVPFCFPDCFSVRAWGCWKEDRRQHEERDELLSLRLSQELCSICLQQKFVKLPLQLCRYRRVTETWLPWAAATWSSNEANNVCSSFNFASASLWDKQGSKEEDKIIRLAWISTAWKGYEFHW